MGFNTKSGPILDDLGYLYFGNHHIMIMMVWNPLLFTPKTLGGLPLVTSKIPSHASIQLKEPLVN
jgi:hypothetical protein